MGSGTKARDATASVTRRAAGRADGGSLAVLRIAIGLVVVLSAVRTWAYGWTDRLYAGPTHRFSYLWMNWVPQPGPVGIRVLVVTTGAAGLALALGWRTRLAAAVLLVSFGWIEAIDATTYLNHYWFVTLLALLALVVPFGATWSFDARRRPTAEGRVALGWVWLLRFQVGVVYASAGLAKLQPDWLLRGLPLRYWLPARSDVPLIGPLLRHPETAHVLSVAGAAFDCAVVPLLLWRRTRVGAWLAVVAFHLITWRLFPIGVFPWLMVAMATVFFEPGWPRALARR
ncbi:MAG: hsdR, partial [Ilumatobacteraceae bacterium]|nr:hsdR [Ilumatobacteraceae bacterium]